MGVFFRFNEKGKILIAKTLFSSKISEEEFEKNSMEISKEKFLSKYNKESKQLSEEITMLELINEKRLSAVGPVSVYLEGEGFYLCGAMVGDKYFPDTYENYLKMEIAIEYGNQFYGKNLMNKMIKENLLDSRRAYDILNDLSDICCSSYVTVQFFFGEEKIDEQTYLKYKREQERLTQIRSASNPLENIKNNVKKNNRK